MEVDTNSTESQREPSPLQAHFVYRARCSNDTLYTGYTPNVDKRIAAHNAGTGARYTRAHLPVTYLTCWSFSSKGDALRAEYAIKQLSRVQKVCLIEYFLQDSLVLPDWVLYYC